MIQGILVSPRLKHNDVKKSRRIFILNRRNKPAASFLIDRSPGTHVLWRNSLTGNELGEIVQERHAIHAPRVGPQAPIIIRKEQGTSRKNSPKGLEPSDQLPIAISEHRIRKLAGNDAADTSRQTRGQGSSDPR